LINTLLTLAEFIDDIGDLLRSRILAKIIGYFDQVGRLQNLPTGSPMFISRSPCICADAVL
jgi:hypothetical protein